MKRSDTVLWSLLNVVAIGALSGAWNFYAAGELYPAIGSVILGAVASIAFVISLYYEFPEEEDIQRIIEDREITQKEIDKISTIIGEQVDEQMTEEMEDQIRDVLRMELQQVDGVDTSDLPSREGE